MTLFLYGALAAHAAPDLPNLEQVYDALDATPAQRAALREIAREAVEDVVTDGTRREALQLLESTVGALLAEDVDAKALEAGRQGVIGLLDRTSEALLPHAVEAVEVLTPAQRARARDLLVSEAGRWLPALGT